MQIKRRALSVVASLAAGVFLFSVSLVNPASAEPITLDDAKAQLQKLEMEESDLGERTAELKLLLEDGRARVVRLNADIEAQTGKVDSLRGQATSVALTQFQSRNLDTTLQLVTSSDPDSFLNQMSTARKVDDNMNSLLQDFQAQQANLSDLRRSADAEVAALLDQQQRLVGVETQLKDKMRQSQALIDRLSAEEQAKINAGTSRDAGRSALVEGDADARALAAVRYALSKVPTGQYVWGAEGPNAFDCSGLMLAAYRSVGVSLPHSSRAQAGAGRAVSLDAMKPGDLIFFYSPIHHVGMYIGNGRFVHARNPRNDLEVDGVYSYGAPVISARRVLG